MSRVAAIVLAAGMSSRMGEGAHKLLKVYRGSPLITLTTANARLSSAKPLVLVTGCRAAEVLAAAGPVDVVAYNPDFSKGLSGSIAAGLAVLPPDVEGALIVLGDMPLVRPATLNAMIRTFEVDRPDAVIPVLAGHDGNPVLVSRALFSALGRLTGDEGARRVLRQGDWNIARLPVDDEGVKIDFDDLGAFERD